MEVLAIIPARGASKGVPGKNKKLLAGKPLLTYTIETAISCPHISEVMVSTEDEEIAHIARRAGAEVPFLRPKELAQDDSPSIDAIMHVVRTYERKNKIFDAVCLMQPTVPFRNSEDVREALEYFNQGNADSLVSMRRVPHKFHPEWVYEEKEGQVVLIMGGTEPVSRRQELGRIWHRDGALYICSWQTLSVGESLYGEKLIHWEMRRSPDINIDTFMDWAAAEEFLNELNG